MGQWRVGGASGISENALAPLDGGMWVWFQMLGKPLLIGLPLPAVSRVIIGYFAVRVAWYVAVVWKWFGSGLEMASPAL